MHRKSILFDMYVCLVFSEVPDVHWGTKFTVSKLCSSTLNKKEGLSDSTAR